ncbi:MAG TPA: HNH endonuclease [Coleofasciculaceae cyanobacterium]|jgi:hypothetical protein
MATIILLCNENYAVTIRQSIESAKKQLVNGELSWWAWSVGKQPIAKVGDRVYIQRTNTYPPAGYFAMGHVVPTQPNQKLNLTNKKYANFNDCYCDEFFDGKYVVQLLIDSVVDYDRSLKLSDLGQKREFEGANFFVPEGHPFDSKYAVALDKVWEDHLVSVGNNGVSAFTILSRKGHEHKQQKKIELALQIYEKGLEVAESVGDLSWVKFFSTQKQQCLAKLQKQNPPAIEKVVEIFPDEVDSSEVFREGAVRQVLVNAYERNSVARKKCIEHYGTECFVCGFSFSQAFGELGKDFIHVHHLKPLSEIGEEYKVNPIEDMRPVCPNCHAMLHRQTSLLSIEQVKAALDQSKHNTFNSGVGERNTLLHHLS